ncbi:MAG: DciA family protein [Betaproteobacteria bacterium]
MQTSLERYLDSAEGAAKTMAHARLLLKLSRRYEAVAPAGLAHVSRVANFKLGNLVIHADNGAVAAKLRQMSTSLCRLLSKEGVECSVMEVKVQPREIPYQSSISKPEPLSPNAGRILRDTAERLPGASPLRAALDKLLKTSNRD